MRHQILTTGLSCLLALGMGVFSATSADAQQPAPQAPQDVRELSDDELETFAEAYLDIDEIRVEMQTRLQAAGDQQAATQIQQEANTRMEETLDEHGLTVQEYQETTQILNADAEQRMAFQQVVEEMRDDSGGSQPAPPN